MPNARWGTISTFAGCGPTSEPTWRETIGYVTAAHIDAFQLMFSVSAGIAVAGALACLLLVRRTDRVAEGPLFSRRSRWVLANVGRTPGVTRHPPPSDSASS